MSSSNEPENEDLSKSNVPLVRMEDIQPCRQGEILESYIIYDVDDYDSEYILMSENDEEANIGSNVSIKANEGHIGTESELIIPDFIDKEPKQISSSTVCNKIEESQHKNIEKVTIDSAKEKPEWPLLEILPGGVIKYADDNIIQNEKQEKETGIFACAKCSQRFTYLFCLVKHIRWHAEQAKKDKSNVGKLKVKKKYVCLHSNKVIPSTQVRRGRKS